MSKRKGIATEMEESMLERKAIAPECEGTSDGEPFNDCNSKENTSCAS
jgi:hypothetical protein